MKKFLVLFLFSVLAFPAIAQAQQKQSVPDYTFKGVKVYENGVRLPVPAVKDIFSGTQAYDVYARGVKNNRVGTALLWPGVGASAIGACLLIKAYNTDHGLASFMVGYAGALFLIAGVPLLVTGIVLKVKGILRVARAVGIYNDYIASSAGNYSPEISFGVTPGGLGLLYKF